MNNRYQSNGESLFVCGMLIMSVIGGLWLVVKASESHSVKQHQTQNK